MQYNYKHKHQISVHRNYKVTKKILEVFVLFLGQYFYLSSNEDVLSLAMPICL